MRICHVITEMRRAAGTSAFCGELCTELVLAGHLVTIAVSSPDRTNRYPVGTHVRWVLIADLVRSQERFDIVHLHALWTPALHSVVKWARKNSMPIVWSTHGMTAPWSLRHKWWKKFPAWFLYQKHDLKMADMVHCTTDLEVEWNMKLGFKNCFSVPLGTRIPTLVDKNDGEEQQRNRVLLFVGRIYPVKALDRLIEAFVKACSISNLKRDWVLRLVGPDQAGHSAELMALCGRLGVAYHGADGIRQCDERVNFVEFAGAKFNKDLDDEYIACDCLALVSHTENFGATVVDAMAHGKPVITSTMTPWKIVSDYNCGWWVSNDVDSLSEIGRAHV